MSSFAHNNGNIHYTDRGEGNPVILVHGFGLDERIWEPQVGELLSKGHRVITYDMRGFGKSSDPEGTYSHEEDLEVLCAHLGVEGVNIVGMSFGGEIAINYAIKYPDNVEGMVLLGPSLQNWKGYPRDLSREAWARLAAEGRFDEVKVELMKHESLASLEGNEDALNIVRGAIGDYRGFHFREDDPYEKMNAEERLSEIKCPVRVIVGSEDASYQREIARTIEENIRNCEVREVEGAGHFLNLEAPDYVNNEILCSLNRENREGSISHK